MNGNRVHHHGPHHSLWSFTRPNLSIFILYYRSNLSILFILFILGNKQDSSHRTEDWTSEYIYRQYNPMNIKRRWEKKNYIWFWTSKTTKLIKNEGTFTRRNNEPNWTWLYVNALLRMDMVKTISDTCPFLYVLTVTLNIFCVNPFNFNQVLKFVLFLFI